MSAFAQTKHPSEQIHIGTDWTAPLDTAETIASATVTVVVQHGNDDAPEEMLSGVAVVNIAPVTLEDGTVVAIGKAVSQRIIGGLPGVVYETRWTVVTNSPRTLEKRVDLIVE